jgi:hypothetical protein
VLVTFAFGVGVEAPLFDLGAGAFWAWRLPGKKAPRAKAKISFPKEERVKQQLEFVGLNCRAFQGQ